MNVLLDKLSKYGVDIHVTMDRFVGDEELYADCLNDFINGNEFILLKKALAEKQYSEAFDYAHSIKGVTGNLGLTPLYQDVCLLVEDLRNNNYDNIENLYTKIIEELTRLCDIISEHL